MLLCPWATGKARVLLQSLWWNLLYEPAWGCSLSRFWIYFCEDWGRHLAILGQSEGQEGCKRKLPWKVRAWCPPHIITAVERWKQEDREFSTVYIKKVKKWKQKNQGRG